MYPLCTPVHEIPDSPNEPYLNGYTWGEFKELTERQKCHEFQKYTQPPATYLGYWKTCALSSCRRAKACKGFLTEAQYREGGYNTSFPPCLGKGAPRHQEMLREGFKVYGPEEDEPEKYAGRPEDNDAGQ